MSTIGDPRVSIIVPCYNAQEFIGRCIESILNQTFRNFELIVINDGSSDESAKIISGYAEMDSRVKNVFQSNAGASSARNHGINLVNCEWITFIDADDYIQPQYLENFFSRSLNNETLYIQGFEEHRPNNITIIDYENHGKELDVKNAFARGRLLHRGHTWGKLYRTSKLNQHNIRFNSDIHYKEDVLFMLDYLDHCKYVEYLYQTDYIYCLQPGSLSWAHHSFNNLCTINNLIEEKINKYQSNQILHEYFRTFRIFCMLEMLESLYSDKDFTSSDRIKSLKYLRTRYSADDFPYKYKSDRLLRLLFGLKFFALFDFLQTSIIKIRSYLSTFSHPQTGNL